MKKAVIFDLGKVLVHYDHSAAMQALTRASGVDVDHMSALFRTVAHAVGVGELDAHELYATLTGATELSVDFAAFVNLFAAGITRDEAALAYAVALQNRPDVTVAVISNTNAAHVLWLDAHVTELTAFDLVMMSNEVGLLKPDPTIYRLALELLDLAPQQTIVVDDLAENVQAAEALGMHGIIHTEWEVTKPLLEAWLAH